MTHRRTIKSSIGDTGVRSVQQRTITVDDSEFDPYDQMPQQQNITPPIPDFLTEFPEAEPIGVRRTRDGSIIKEQEEVVAEEPVRAPPQAVSRLEVIIGMTRLVREVKFKNVKFLIATLKSKEHRDMILNVINDDLKTSAEQSYSIRRHTLSRAIQEINGMPINVALGSNNFEDRLLFIDELDESIVQKLFLEYESMREEHVNSIDKDLGKTSQEVAESIKK
jgi:hypothetical protein